MVTTQILFGVAALALLVIIPWASAVSVPLPVVLDKVIPVPSKSPISAIPPGLALTSVPTVSSTPSTAARNSTPSVPVIPPEPSVPSIVPEGSISAALPTIEMPIILPPLFEIPAIPDVPDLNFALIQKNYMAFTATLPKTILDDAKLMVPELIEKNGYPCETHKITTADGYIVNMHRIPYGRSGPSEKRPIAFVQHGVLSSSADWIIPGPEKALGYLLADAGYDVWLPNARGTRYSRNHLTLDPDNAKFWDFSWHEIAIYDVPAMIDYALNQTKQEKLFYIGHSQGTTVFYVMCSEKPEYNKKIRAQFSLAPIGYMSHMTSPLLKVISKAEGGLGFLLKLIGVNEFVPNTGFVGRVGKLLCGDDSVTQILCTNSMFAVCGFNQKQMNATLLPVIMGHTPAGASTKQLLHYGQEINSGKFRQWDYGFLGNRRQYTGGEIPRYQLNKVTAPVYLYYSENDWLSGERDVMRLYVELANVQQKILVADKKFNHIDYLYAIQARELVYDHLIDLMTKH